MSEHPGSVDERFARLEEQGRAFAEQAARLAARCDALDAENAALRATIAGQTAAGRAGPVEPTPIAEPVGLHDSGDPASVAIGRRAALKRAGAVAAGAVAGGAALVAGTASPAAAAAGSFSGAPAVLATGVGGDGVSAGTNTAGKSGVYGHTGVSGAYGIWAEHTNEVGLHVESAAKAGSSAAEVVSTSSGYALTATGSLAAARFHSTAAGIAVRVDQDSVGTAVQANIKAGGTGFSATSTGGIGGTGYYVSNVQYGLVAASSTVGASLHGTQAAFVVQQTQSTIPPDATGSHDQGEFYRSTYDVWYCTAPGTPGTWRKLAGRDTAGQLHLLPAPVRVYDSRAGTAPAVGSKTPLAPNVARVVDLKANSSTVPAGATGALVTVLLVNAASGNGNFTLWADGVAKPQANTLVWGGSTGRFTAKELTALDSQARIQVSASLKTDVVIDVVGYYR